MDTSDKIPFDEVQSPNKSITEMTQSVEQLLSVPAAEENKEELVAIQSEVASKLLQQKGWDIAKELFDVTYESLEVTKLYVFPVITKQEELSAKLGDKFPEFKTRFDALKEDLAVIAETLSRIYLTHASKTGAVADDELKLISEVTLGYSLIQTQMEEQVGPEMLRQLEALEAGGVGADFLIAAVQEPKSE